MTRGRIGLLMTLAVGLFATPCAANAQPITKVARMGVLFVGAPPSSPDWQQRSLFLQALRDLGWLEGQNLMVEHRWASGKVDRLADLAAELVRLKVDVLVVRDTDSLHAARQATTTIPIVTLTPADPVALGYVASLARPGGNITGVGSEVQQLGGKLLEVLKGAVPQVTEVAVLAPREGDETRLVRETEDAARALGVRLHVLEVRSADEFERAFETASRARVGALLILPGLLPSVHQRRLAALAAHHRLPAIYTSQLFAEAGGLLAYGPKRADFARLAAAYVDRLLKGAKPADLPVERVTTFELVINLKTAQALGLTIPPTLLFQATEVLR
jgi:putative tryptophan/tyrosine transport system substrate-binding protein